MFIQTKMTVIKVLYLDAIFIYKVVAVCFNDHICKMNSFYTHIQAFGL